MTTRQAVTTFDAETHTYRINDRPVPSVTQVIEEVLQPVWWNATEWHLARGHAIHAAAAMVARKQKFIADERLGGYIAACNKFLAECVDEIWEVERMMFSESLQFAGTTDLICSIRGRKGKVLVDYKHTLTDLVGPQLGGYSILDGGTINQGIGVALKDDGTYQFSSVYDLRRSRNEFLALRTAYGIKARLGLLTRTQNQKEEAGTA